MLNLQDIQLLLGFLDRIQTRNMQEAKAATFIDNKLRQIGMDLQKQAQATTKPEADDVEKTLEEVG